MNNDKRKGVILFIIGKYIKCYNIYIYTIELSRVSVHKIVNYAILNTTFYYAWTHEQLRCHSSVVSMNDTVIQFQPHHWARS